MNERLEEWRELVHMNEFDAAILLRPVFFLTALPCSGGYHLEKGGMSLHDAVGITVKRAQLLKIKMKVSSICAKRCMLIIMFVLSDFT